MAKKKSSKQKTPSPKEFSSSPFKSLKGLSAFAEQEPPLQKNRAEQTTTDDGKRVVSSAQYSFADEMGRE